jgi:hypothetical protein
MPDGPYNQSGGGFAKDLKRAREIQREFLSQTGETMTRKEALDQVRIEKLEKENQERAQNQALRDAQPEFVKDGKGVRGPQEEGKHRQMPGADGKGGDMQVRPGGGQGRADAVLRQTTIIAVNNNGARELLTVYIQ